MTTTPVPTNTVIRRSAGVAVAVAVIIAVCSGGWLLRATTAGHDRARPSPGSMLTPAWRAATRARLLDLLVPTPSMPVFQAPIGGPELLPSAHAALALALTGHQLPTTAVITLNGFWQPSLGLYADRAHGAPPLAATWMVLRLSALNPHGSSVGSDRASRMLEALRRRVADPLTDLYRARVATLLRPMLPAAERGALNTVLRTVGSRACGRRPQALYVAAWRAETTRLSNTRCAFTDVTLGERALAAEQTRLRSTTAAGLPDVLRTAALLEMARAGEIPIAAPQSHAATMLASAEHDLSPKDAGFTDEVATVVDLARSARQPLTLPRPWAADLERTLRWRGELPVIGAGDPVSSTFAIAALSTLSGTASATSDSPDRVNWEAPSLQSWERLLMAATVDPARVTARDIDKTATGPAVPSTRTYVVADALSARPAACTASARRWLSSTVSRLPSSTAQIVAPFQIHALLVIVDGASVCGSPAAMATAHSLRSSLGGALALTRTPVGLFGVRPGAAPDLIDTWAGVEANCTLTGTPRVDRPAAMALLRRTTLPAGGAGIGNIDALSTYAALRLDALISGRCTNA